MVLYHVARFAVVERARLHWKRKRGAGEGKRISNQPRVAALPMSAPALDPQAKAAEERKLRVPCATLLRQPAKTSADQ
jgi:hypothetical protein